MNTCPNCGVANDQDTSVCICGHLFESEDELNHGWETMKDVPTQTFRRFIPHAIWVTVVLAVLGLAFTDPGLRAKLLDGEYSPEHRIAETKQTPDRSSGNVTAKVVSVLDGESFTAVDRTNYELHVRLAGVDAPEPGDYFGEQARQNLAGLIADKTVTIEKLKSDADDLVLARVTAEGKNINLEQIRGGYAWISGNATEFLTSGELEDLRQNEVAARSSKLGIWTRWDVVVNSDVPAPSPVNDLTAPVSRDGAIPFEKSSLARSANENVRSTFTGGQKPVTPNANPFDSAQATGNHAYSHGESKEDSDCKPEASTISLKQPEPVKVVEDKPTVPARNTGNVYILGPRGGCFFVTASGSKKYVDHSLCGQTTAAAARQ